MAKQVPQRQKTEIVERAHNLCEYCLSPARFATQSFSIEHILPRSRGGADELGNLAWACQGCNSFKGVKTTGIDPLTNRRVPLFHPRQQHWGDHFTWNDNFTHVLGLTPTGRATIVVLQLNRNGLTNLREALHAFGKHPPTNAVTQTF